MEPETGASTWALGSHKCTLYIGNLTINEEIVIIIRINLKPVMISLWLDWEIMSNWDITHWLDWEPTKIMIANKGRAKQKV